MIKEADIEKAVTYLREKAEEAAQARANVKYIEQFLKSKKAQIKAAQQGLSNAAAEDVALASPDYLEALEGYRAAVELDAKHAFKREAAGALIDAWRTQQASLRTEGRAYS